MGHEPENDASRPARERVEQPLENAPPPIVDSRSLLGGRSELRIRHGGEIYRLLLTRNGKLILNK